MLILLLHCFLVSFLTLDIVTMQGSAWMEISGWRFRSLMSWQWERRTLRGDMRKTTCSAWVGCESWDEHTAVIMITTGFFLSVKSAVSVWAYHWIKHDTWVSRWDTTQEKKSVLGYRCGLILSSSSCKKRITFHCYFKINK